MSFFEFSASDLESLAKLLTPPAEAAEEKHDAVSSCEISRPSPATIGPKDLLPVKVAAPRQAQGRSDVKKQPAWVQEADTGDGRETPEYDFYYKQSVTTSDNFLGMSGKDPSSTCCEHLVVVLQLPQAKSAAELDLDTTPTQLHLQSPAYKLRLPLPHKVDSERGSAKWDSKKKTLSITLPIIRDDLFH